MIGLTATTGALVCASASRIPGTARMGPMLVTGLLGAFWGVVYLRRRSAVAPMVSHAGFDLLQILQFVTMRASGFRL